MINGVIPAAWQPQIHGLLRIMTGLLFLQHGTSKMLKFPMSEQLAGMYSQMGGMTMFTGIIELVGGILIIIGLFTRLTAFILSGFMAVAYWMVHVGMMGGGFFPLLNGGELAALYCFVFLFLAVAGAGAWSMDAGRSKN